MLLDTGIGREGGLSRRGKIGESSARVRDRQQIFESFRHNKSVKNIGLRKAGAYKAES